MKVYISKIKRRRYGIYIAAGIFGILLFGAVSLFCSERRSHAAEEEAIRFESDADFKVLEIVPYHAMGEMGYLVGDEEPINMNRSDFLSRYDTELKYRINSPDYLKDLIQFELNSQNMIENQEVFKRKIMRLSEEEVQTTKVDVLSLTPEEVNTYWEYVKEAKLIYITAEVKNTEYLNFYSLYGKDEMERDYLKDHVSEITGDKNKIPNFYYKYNTASGFDEGGSERVGNDLKWEVVYDILKAVAEKKQAVFIDASTYTTFHENWKHNIPNPYTEGTADGTSNNVAKLFLMLRQRDPKVFYDTYMETNIITRDGNGVYTGTSKSLTQKYWNQDTFLPELPEGKSNPSEYYEDLGISNSWVSNESQLSRVHNTAGCNKAQIALNSRMGEKSWTDPELLAYVKERDGLASMPANADTYDAINYIISCLIHADIYKRELTILDLEPCNEQKLTVTMVQDWCQMTDEEKNGPNKINIKIVPMTTSEFNGTNENLSECYDLIYFGNGESLLNKQGNQIVYNDSDLNGRVYLHAGDQVPAMSNQTYRFSGNDITSLKKAELYEYLEEFPVIASADFYSGHSVKESYIDKSSEMYSLLQSKEAKIVRDNSGLNRSKMASLLNKQKLRIEKSGSWPTEYEWGNVDTEMPKYLSGRDLSFKFKINTIEQLEKNPRHKYRVDVYVDYNGNERFEESEKKTILTDGEARMEYTKGYHLKDEASGIFKIMLKVTDQIDNHYTASYTNYVAVKGSKKVVRVLQIVPNGYNRGSDDDATQYLDLSKINTTAGLDDVLKKLLNKQDAFDFKFDTITVDELKRLYLTNASEFMEYWTSDSEKKEIFDSLLFKPLYQTADFVHYIGFDESEVTTSRLMGYDLIILGANQCFKDIEAMDELLDSDIRNDLVKDMKMYLDNNKSILLLKDSSSNNIDVENHAGYQMTKLLRDRAGMDRYDTTTGSSKALYVKGNEISENTQKQGFTNPVLNKIIKNEASTKYSLNTIRHSTELGSDKVTQLNKGSITSYPYSISKEFNCANTSAQYYQLDLEIDKDSNTKSDVIVWYCLSDHVTGQQGMYSSSPNDAVNQYYLYSIGQVFYSAMSQAPGEAEYRTADEKKLFVNTLVAACRNVSTGVGSSDTLYRYIDHEVDAQFSEDYMKGLLNLPIPLTEAPSEELYEKIPVQVNLPVSESIHIVVTGMPVDNTGIAMPFTLYSGFDKVTAVESRANTIYYVYVPKCLTQLKGKFEVDITADGYHGKVILLNRNLFRLG